MCEGRVLLCQSRKRAQPLILPGGKREAGESSLDTLAREIHEELGGVQVLCAGLLGTYTAPAATGLGSPPRIVEIELFAGSLSGPPTASSEIEALVWFGPEDDWGRLAPSLSTLIFPDLQARKLLPW
jgi:8-oxo-dGTP pyrophosphatase MutT (NUDIX family)